MDEVNEDASCRDDPNMKPVTYAIEGEYSDRGMEV